MLELVDVEGTADIGAAAQYLPGREREREEINTKAHAR